MRWESNRSSPHYKRRIRCVNHYTKHPHDQEVDYFNTNDLKDIEEQFLALVKEKNFDDMEAAVVSRPLVSSQVAVNRSYCRFGW
jgi:hypothetical protein